MTAFDKCFLFLDSPRGGVENLSDMKAAGFDGLMVNVRDYPAHEWEAVIVPRAKQLGMFCGPWGRTATATHQWDESVLDNIIAVADRWGSPLVVNSEVEINGSGDTLTKVIAAKVGTRDAAISTEPWLFALVDWTPVAHLPVLLQIFPAEQSTTKTEEQRRQCKGHAHEVGVRCVYFTFGTYGGMKPGDFDLKAPYSLFTGDAMGAAYASWSSTSSGFLACQEPPPTPGVPMLTDKQFPYTGPKYGPNAPGRDQSVDSPTVKGLKRGMIRLGFLLQDLGSATDDYGADLESAIDIYQRAAGIKPATGQYGRNTWLSLRSDKLTQGPHKGEYAMDALALRLVREDALVRCYPHPLGSLSEVCQGLHPTAGLAGNWAIDFCAPGGTKVLAVERSTVRKLSGHDPAGGANQTIGIFGWSIHYETADGYRYFSTHYGSRNVSMNQIVEPGQVVGTVGHWPGDPSRSHTHLGVTSPFGQADSKKRIEAISKSPKVAA